ncbi:MAG: hypothetical protein K2M12_03430 [Muribaculaceae bacterium]|nr:hypothetical protein [Muribaculaceae bacterium]
MKSFLHIAICFAALVLACLRASATNIVTYTVTDSMPASEQQLVVTHPQLSNGDDRTRISFVLNSSNAPFTIYRAEWINCDSVYTPLEPFSLIGQPEEVAGKCTVWDIAIDFPFRDQFDTTDRLILTTDRGTVSFFTTTEGRLLQAIDLMREDFGEQIESSRRSSHLAWIILLAVLAGAATAALVARRKFVRNRRQIEELSMLVAERTHRNKELEDRVGALYSSRLDTLNMLCNEYFEKNESEKVRLSLYAEVEKHILALRDPGSIATLQQLVNTYLDNILVRLKEQIPSLTRSDLIFLTYIYAGFSPRAVCIFTDIKIKNFYNRRSRLKERILASDAPDKQYFASKMQL